MPRKPRFYLPDVPVHLVQRGHNRDPVFFEPEDYREYLGRLVEAGRKYQCAVHAYVLMTNHVHVLLTPKDGQGPSRLMQYVGRYYVPYINHKYGRSGSIWEGRYKASLIDDHAYLLICMRYIELNPVRADMIDHPAAYPWSSYRCNALGQSDILVEPHATYKSLGDTPETQRNAYQALFQAHMDSKTMKQVRNAWQTGTPLGNDRFKDKIEQALGRKVGQARRGRPTGMKIAKLKETTDAKRGLKGL